MIIAFQTDDGHTYADESFDIDALRNVFEDLSHGAVLSEMDDSHRDCGRKLRDLIGVQVPEQTPEDTIEDLLADPDEVPDLFEGLEVYVLSQSPDGTQMNMAPVGVFTDFDAMHQFVKDQRKGPSDHGSEAWQWSEHSVDELVSDD